MSKSIPAQPKYVHDDDTIDTGRPWPFSVTLQLRPFDIGVDVHVTIEAPMSAAEAETLGGLLVNASDAARAVELHLETSTEDWVA